MERLNELNLDFTSSTVGHAENGYSASGFAREALARQMVGGGLPFAALFDELAFGIAIVDFEGVLVHASRAARMQLQARRGLEVNGNRVVGNLPSDDLALSRAIAGAVAGRRSYMAMGQAGNRLDVAVLPLESQCAQGKPTVVLVFEKAAGSGGLSLYFFAQAYGLTRAEQSVLGELSDGASAVDAARQLGSSVHTVRTHVRNILSKTGQPNLRGLTRRIGMLPPVGTRFAIAHTRGEALGGAASAPEVPIVARRVPPAKSAGAACALAA